MTGRCVPPLVNVTVPVSVWDVPAVSAEPSSVVPLSAVPSRATLLEVTVQPAAGVPAALTAMPTGGRHEAGPVSFTWLPCPVACADTSRPGSSTGPASRLSPVVPSMDQTAQPWPRGAVASCGAAPAIVPPLGNRTTAACRVSVRFATATSSHSLEMSAIRPLASATGSWLDGAQEFLSPVSCGGENELPVQRDTTGE